MRNLDFVEKMDKAKERVGETLESVLGLGLRQPNNITNSGSRKILYETQSQQKMPLLRPERRIIGTGYDEKYGDRSSSIDRTPRDGRVVAKISKFSFAPDHHYWLIMVNDESKTIWMHTRISYKHKSESYGYLYNNECLDKLTIGEIVPAGTIIQKSLSYDEYNNRKDGVNLESMDACLDDNMEDGIVISESAAYKLASPLIKEITLMINDNTIPLNLYGTNDIYKSIPHVGEKVGDNGVLVALRTKSNEDSLFCESNERLKTMMVTDDIRKLNGIVLDIDVKCNNVENLEKDPYCEQFYDYYKEQQRVNNELLKIILEYQSKGYTIDDWNLETKVGLAKLEYQHTKYVEKIDNKPFSYMKVDIVVLEELPMKAGDKMTNTHGAKGVVSKVVPDYMMPYKEDGTRIEMIKNSGGMTNRENIAQCADKEYAFIGHKIVEYIRDNPMHPRDAINMIILYFSYTSPKQSTELYNLSSSWSDEDCAFYIDSILLQKDIEVRAEPASEAFDIFKLAELYKQFEYVGATQEPLYVPITDSNGKIRYAKSRRNVITAKEYVWRLQQFAEEKFSSTSLSSTNIRNQNIKSKASKNYKEVYSDTPIRAGDMEINQLSSHLGADIVVANLMLHSTSPHGRRLVEQFYTHDPYEIDIKLDNEAKNRSAEEVVTLLKTIGLRINFSKKLKQYESLIEPRCPFDYLDGYHPGTMNPFAFIHDEGYDFVEAFKKIEELENSTPFGMQTPFEFL